MQNRRRFIQQVAIGSGAAFVGNPLRGVPIITGGSDKLGSIMGTRPFGKTGENVTIFALGGSHVVKSVALGESPQALIEKSLEEGVRFFDNAYRYGEGRAEELYGKYLTPKYREHVFLMTKSRAKNEADVKRQLDESLQRLNTDYLDLWLIHSVASADDVDERLDNGVLDAFLAAKESGKARYIGFTGHITPTAHKRLMDRVNDNDPFDYVQLPINALDPSKPDSFAKELLPDLVDRGYAVGAMKTLAHGRFFGNASTNKLNTNDPVIPNHISLEEALWFVLSQPVTCIVSGNDKMKYLKQNIDIVKRFSKLSSNDQEQIIAKVSKFRMTPKLEGYRPDPRTLA